MPSVLPRVTIALIALLLVAWSAVLWRNQIIGGGASDRVLGTAQLSEADWERILDDFRDAELLDPSSDWPLMRAGVLILRGDRAAAASIADSVLDSEPDSLQAWTLLLRATEGRVPRRAAEARAQILRLNPPVGDP
jgi:hypothetical protein